jgi:hypothetical protein
LKLENQNLKLETILLSTAYLAPIQYYCKLIGSEKVIIEQHENYSKQSYRNRCNILTANGVLSLAIPVIHNGGNKIPIRDVEIDYSTRWKAMHCGAIESAYRSSPFYIYYSDEFWAVFDKKFKYLFDFNSELQNFFFDQLKIKIEISFSSSFKCSELQSTFEDLSNSIHPKARLNMTDEHFKLVPYFQVFQNKYGFVPNLSIIDLLFNVGPSAINILVESNQ